MKTLTLSFRALAARSRSLASTLLILPIVAACAVGTTGCVETIYGQCAEPLHDRLVAEPPTLAATGLFTDVKSNTLAPGVVEYRPQFELWSDGATKRRWIYLPPGAQIDTRDMDAWQFPTGTKFWKEFTRSGVRVETRLLHKVGPDAAEWVALAYVWNSEGNDAIAAPDGIENARGTPHDVPPAGKCMGCHGGTPSRVLGFGAIQLAREAPDHQMSLPRLMREDRLTRPPPPSLRVPGDSATQQALGYLHANCAHCHNQQRPPSTGPRCFDPRKDFDLSLRVDRLTTPERTPAYATTVGRIMTPGDADGSALFRRVASGTFYQPRMPVLGTETADPNAVLLLRTWIETMPVRQPSRAAFR